MFDFMIERTDFSSGCAGLLCFMHKLHHTDERICFIDNKMILSETWSKQGYVKDTLQTVAPAGKANTCKICTSAYLYYCKLHETNHLITSYYYMGDITRALIG